jgi:hypothetical protein
MADIEIHYNGYYPALTLTTNFLLLLFKYNHSEIARSTTITEYLAKVLCGPIPELPSKHT